MLPRRFGTASRTRDARRMLPAVKGYAALQNETLPIDYRANQLRAIRIRGQYGFQGPRLIA